MATVNIATRWLLGLFVALATVSLPTYADLYIASTSFDEGWVKRNEPIRFKLGGSERILTGQFAIFIGDTDSTVLFHEEAPREFVYTTTSIPLPKGENDFVIYRKVGIDEWNEIDRRTLRVLSGMGFETIEVTPSLNLSNDSQWSESHSRDAGAPERDEYRDVDGAGGVSVRMSRGDLSINSDFTLVGSSHRPKTLRFGEKGVDADKIDLSRYEVEVRKGNTALSVGHISFGNNPLLVSNLSNRGVLASHKFSERLDVTVATQNATRVVGFDNILGLETADHNISGMSVGYDVLGERRGELRAVVSYVKASVESQNNFDFGEVLDAEKSTGYGIQLTGATPSRRLRGDFNFARSEYRNPDDPTLDQGFDVVRVEETTNNARRLNLYFDLLANRTDRQGGPITAVLSYHHEKIDPEYKTLAAFANADQLRNEMALAIRFGGASTELRYSRSEDNLDGIDTILQTKTRVSSVNISAPLGSLYKPEDSDARWWPTVSYSYQRVHQFAGNDPDPASSGFNGGSHLPDQVTNSQSLGFYWSFERWNISYSGNYSYQDNRQVGREKDDFERFNQQVSGGYRVTDNLSVNANLGRSRNEDRAQSNIFFTTSIGTSVNWTIRDDWAVSASFSFTKDDDDDNTLENESQTGDVQLSYQFETPAAGYRRLPGQLFVRYSRQENKSDDKVFGFNSSATNWAVTSGLSLSFF